MPELQATASFGRYQDAILLGSGGMGAVYRALDPSLDRYVAIKVLTHRDPRYVERFRREAQVLARIGHPAIIQIYEIDGSDNYSLGITAFHLLTGRKPFEAKSKVDVMLMQVKTPLPQIAQFVPCDERVAGIVEKMGAKKPGERYQSCDELMAAIDALPRPLGGREGGTAAPSEERTRLLPAAARRARTRSASGQPQRTRSRPAAKPSSVPWGAVAAGAAAAMLLLAAGGFLYLRGRTASVDGVPETGWISRGGLRR